MQVTPTMHALMSFVTGLDFRCEPLLLLQGIVSQLSRKTFTSFSTVADYIYHSSFDSPIKQNGGDTHSVN